MDEKKPITADEARQLAGRQPVDGIKQRLSDAIREAATQGRVWIVVKINGWIDIEMCEWLTSLGYGRFFREPGFLVVFWGDFDALNFAKVEDAIDLTDDVK